MSFTQAGVNDYNFSEVTESDKQILVTNGLGRTAKYAELVYLGGYFGEVREYAGIANSETGRININSERLIRTKQVKATTTFTVGQPVYFLSGGSSPFLIQDKILSLVIYLLLKLIIPLF